MIINSQEAKILMIEVSTDKADMLLTSFDCFSRVADGEHLVPDTYFIDDENKEFWVEFLGENYPEGGLDQYAYISFCCD